MIEKLHTDALLSAAAYANWGLLGSPSEHEIKNELIDNRGFTEAQYNALFDPVNGLYSVYQGDSVGYAENANGFSATIFENRLTGELTVAFRGTEPGFADFVLADLLLALGLSSITDLFSVGQVSSIASFFIDAGLADANGNLLVAANSINFVGHSLGGHLATMAAYKYPDLVNQVVTFNGAGLQGWDEIWNTYIAGSISGGALDEDRITNYYADKGMEVTADQDLWFSRPGGRQAIFIEEDSPIENHSIAKLVESISVYRILALLDPALDSEPGLEKIYHLLDVASNIPDRSLETVITHLGDLLGGDLPASAGDIELFYQGLLTESGALKPEYQGLSIVPLITTNSGNIVSISADALRLAAQSSLAYRYALVHLDPFVITGNDALYAAHNANGELALENFSDQYLTDRSRLLALKIRLGQADAETETPSADGNRDYLDMQDLDAPLELRARRGFTDPAPVSRIVFGSDRSDGRIDGDAGADRLYGGAGIETLYGEDGADYLEGNGDADVLVGGEGADVLAGGAGDDVLAGGLWDAESPDHTDDTALDTLRGGAGNDAYHVGHRDSIDDSDPINQTALLDFNGVDARGTYTRLVEGVYQQEATGLVLTLSGTAARIRRIEGTTVTYFTIENFLDAGGQHTAGAYGITLDEPTAPAPISTYTNPDEAGGFTVADYYLLEGTTPVAGPFTDVVGNATWETLWIDRSPGLQVALGEKADSIRWGEAA